MAVPWASVSPRGLKQDSDDPYHTDWMLGAGLHPLDMRPSGTNPHWESLKEAAYRARFEVEKRLLGFSCSVLLCGPTVRGRVHVPTSPRDLPPDRDEDGLPPVLVVGNVGTDWMETVLATLELGGAVVAERGGEMAHLVTVVRETGYGPIIRVPDARRRYHTGAVVIVCPREGRITLVEDERLSDRFEPPPPALTHPDQAPETGDGAIDGAAVPDIDVPDFGLVEKRPGGSHPAETCRYLEPRRKLEEPRHVVYANALFSDSNSGDAYLMILVKEKGNGRTRRRTFYSDLRKWSAGDVARACLQALYVISRDSGTRAQDRRMLAPADGERRQS
jgi:hypothetical protein